MERFIIAKQPANRAYRPRRRSAYIAQLAGMVWLIATLATGCAEHENSASRESTPHELDAARVDAALQTAEEYLNAGDLVNAEAILTRLVERVPSDARGFELLAHTQLSRGVTARGQGEHDHADHYFEQAYRQLIRVIELSPNEPGFHQSAGEIAQMLGRDQDALKHYRRAQQLDPGDSKPALLGAQILIENDRLDEAEEALLNVLLIDPDEPLAHVSLANVRLKQAQFEEALVHLREAREIDPAELSFRVLEARILRQSGRPLQALDLLVPLNEAQRARHSIASEIAAAYRALDRPRDAARAWGLVYHTRPGDEQAWLAAVHAGEAMLDAGELSQARTWLHEALRMGENTAEVAKFADRIREAADTNFSEDGQ